MSLDDMLWEGWTGWDLVEENADEIDMIMRGRSWKEPFETKEELAAWMRDEILPADLRRYVAPCHIDYFAEKYDLS
jgi:hypothetical protein